MACNPDKNNRIKIQTPHAHLHIMSRIHVPINLQKKPTEHVIRDADIKMGTLGQKEGLNHEQTHES